MPAVQYGVVALCAASGHAAAETVAVTTQKQLAKKAMDVELMRRRMEEEKARRRALIAAVS